MTWLVPAETQVLPLLAHRKLRGSGINDETIPEHDKAVHNKPTFLQKIKIKL
ncbi:hypothetical protein HOC37_00700 [bacterium]|jgi:hypothetical protein|nr:hypothetical protein [bacterium]MBT3581482.1 hypothetical protein [bacterium]MBT4551484.1 hypothetical protein [bacterium]MBT7088820.1 hypothetical protein [bacterium]